MRVEGDPDPAKNGVYYLHADHLGSASLTTDAGGNPTSQLRYLPYGAPRSGSSPTDRQFTGQREEATLGSLYDYGARFYSPVLGRFLSADTIVPSPGNPQSLNRYAYVNNNPLKYTDPTGHAAECSHTAGGGCEPGPLEPVEIKQAPPDTLDNVGAVGETIGSILFEPVDWVVTARDCLGGQCSPWMLAGLLPLIPSSVGKYADDAIDTLQATDKLGDVARIADNNLDDLLKRAFRNENDRYLRKGEKGLSVYIGATDEQIHKYLRGDIKAVARSEVEDLGMTVAKTPGDFPELDPYHYEISQGLMQTWKQFTAAIKELFWR